MLGGWRAQDLSFPEAVRKRPGMYIGDHRDGSGLLHMALEIVGNAIDQHRAGWARRLDVRLKEDWVEVEDDGRGFAIEPHLGGASFVERAITFFHHEPTLDAHFPHVHVTDGRGIGIAPVAALSRRFEVDSFLGGRA